MEYLGIELEPSLHDGYLFGVLVTPSKELELSCETEAGEKIRIRLPGLVRLRADEFLEGNTIFGVCQYQAAAPEELLNFVFGLGDEPGSKGREFADRTASNWTLLHLRSSYGCELVALATGQAIVERSEALAGC